MISQLPIGPVVPQGTSYPFSSAIGAFTIGLSPIGVVPALPPPYPNTIPAYLYWEYSTDDDLQSWFAAYNTYTQAFVSWFADLNLPNYTGDITTRPGWSSALLDWVAAGVYGITRPVFSSGVLATVGPYNTFAYNTLPYNELAVLSNLTYQQATDDIFQRVITWHFFKGDGKYFSVPLKRRVLRFLTGEFGSPAILDYLTPASPVTGLFPSSNRRVSVTFGAGDQVTRFVPTADVYAGPYNTFAYNTLPYNELAVARYGYDEVTEDTYDLVSIRLIDRVVSVVGGSIYDTFAYNTTPYNALQTVVSPLPAPPWSVATAVALQEGIEQGVLETPVQLRFTVDPSASFTFLPRPPQPTGSIAIGDYVIFELAGSLIIRAPDLSLTTLVAGNGDPYTISPPPGAVQIGSYFLFEESPSGSLMIEAPNGALIPLVNSTTLVSPVGTLPPGLRVGGYVIYEDALDNLVIRAPDGTLIILVNA